MADTLTITLTDRPPVSINEDQWPIVARGKGWDNTHECQANRTWTLTARQHADGRAIVYGRYTTQWQGEDGRNGGVYLDQTDTTAQQIADAIRQVGTHVGFSPTVIDECIADMPAETIE